MPNEAGYQEPELEKVHFDSSATIPDTFDVRTQWPECAAVTGRVSAICYTNILFADVVFGFTYVII